jgi:hypothetical protein
MDGCRTDIDRKQNVGFRDDLLVHVGSGMKPGQARPRPLQRHFQPQTISGNNTAPELGVINAAKRRTRRKRRLGTIEHEHCRELRQRLDLKDGGHDRDTREVPLEELLANGHVLYCHEPVARLVFSDSVDEIRRVSVVDAPKERRKV